MTAAIAATVPGIAGADERRATRRARRTGSIAARSSFGSSEIPPNPQMKFSSSATGECRPWVEHERGALAQLGVYATPQAWINGRPVPGGYKPLEGLKPLLDEELARAKQRIAAGTPREAYYTEWVMKKGLPRIEVASN